MMKPALKYRSLFTRNLMPLCILLISPHVFSQEAGSVVKGATQPILISKQFAFTEGPAADKAGNVFFTDQPNNKIWKFSTQGKLSVFLDSAGRSNGMYFDSKGNLITCADEKNELWSISPGGKVTVLVKDFKGHQFNGPNDLWIDKKDGIYFTDPYYQRDYWDRKSPDTGLGGEHLYYLPRGKQAAVIADTNLRKPNGIVGSADGKYLYVSDIGAGKIYRYQVNKDATLTNQQLFVEHQADGLTVDRNGNVYLAGKGITVYDPSGKQIEQIEIPEGWTANLCFGGSDRDILFVTASKSVYILPMAVRGVK